MPVVIIIMLVVAAVIACVVLLVVAVTALRQWKRSAIDIADRRARVLSSHMAQG